MNSAPSRLSRITSIPNWARQSITGLTELGAASLSAYMSGVSPQVRLVRIQPHSTLDNNNSPTQPTFIPTTSTLLRNQTINPYPSNRISNTKYTLISFLPKFCYEQFGRFMNFYFLLVASLQLIHQLTPINPVATWTPLLFIFALSGFKEAVDDYRRLVSDRASNDRIYNRVSSSGELQPIQSQTIQVGDILCLEEGEEIPCDLVLLKSSHERGEALLLTSNIDGETNLKTLVAPAETLDFNFKQLGELRGVIECPLPNPHLHRFEARLKLVGGTDWIPVGPQQLLLQGAVLKHPSTVCGVAVYTGTQTKLGNNKQPASLKLTILDQQIETASFLIFVIQLVVVIFLGVIGNYLRRVEFGPNHFYLMLKEEHSRAKTLIHDLIIPLRMLLLLSLMIPISLKVSMDICKFVCSQFVGWDLKLYDSVGGPAIINNTSIADDLGQIEYVFTDKTGTLTENQMVYFGCTINGRLSSDPDFGYDQVSTELFYTTLALCHSVQLSVETEGSNMFQGTSPDEEALVWAAYQAGYQFLGKHTNTLKFNLGGDVRTYDLLHTLEFSSSRKRMSILVRLQSDQPQPVILLTKGADDTVLPVCRASPTNVKIKHHLVDYAQQGLRTLTIAYRIITEDEYMLWHAGHIVAETSIQDRDGLLESSAVVIERDLILLGGTAIEDRLQPKVPQTIASIRKAGIKVWMLTGDKLATAIQIARSCSLLPPASQQTNQGRMVVLASDEITLPSLIRCLQNEVQTLSPRNHSNRRFIKPPPFSLVVDGGCLTWILENSQLQGIFIDLSLAAQSVICCRSTPKQKGEVIDAIKARGKVTLAIGDGGNDVVMIQQANIGIGLRGREGLQAARAADLSVSRFFHLNRLLLIHGRYSLHRVRFVALYCFYKSIVISMVQAGFQVLSGFSGASLLTSYALSLYNVAYTGLPILFYVLDKDISERSLLNQPGLYQNIPGRDPRYKLLSGTFRWFSWACIQGLLILFVSILLDSESSSISEWGGSGFSFSYKVYSAVVVTVQLTLALATNHFTLLNQLIIFGGIVVYFLGTAITSRVFPNLGMAEIAPLFLTVRFWLHTVIIVSLLVLPYWVVVYLMYANPKNPSRNVRLSTILESRRQSILTSFRAEDPSGQPLLDGDVFDEPDTLNC